MKCKLNLLWYKSISFTRLLLTAIRKPRPVCCKQELPQLTLPGLAYGKYTRLRGNSWKERKKNPNVADLLQEISMEASSPNNQMVSS